MKAYSSFSIIFAAFFNLPFFLGKANYQKSALTLPQIERKVLIVFIYHLSRSPRLFLSSSFFCLKKYRKPQLFFTICDSSQESCSFENTKLNIHEDNGKIWDTWFLSWPHLLLFSSRNHSKPNEITQGKISEPCKWPERKGRSQTLHPLYFSGCKTREWKGWVHLYQQPTSLCSSLQHVIY